ncbi:lysozyme [Hoeflea sp. YIM 152468]|uniref:lysozyme n=1 Tax=Hoeflea sp. YIM 152468 TaxID=3031759 RepID=UPI0023DB7A5F|nr:lysozyme [Hoeflea sp. YIM 152468]MDF1606943.1 lysozyme [Hoeflea sp. YIM 152468]
MSKRAKSLLAGGAAGVIALTAVFMQPWEGTKNLAYWDSLGRVWTVCTGETKGVKKGDRYTDKQCAEMLQATLEKDYRQPLTKCIPGFDGYPLGWQVAILSLTYNVGPGAVCKSTAARLAIAGDLEQSCQAMTWFNRAGGKVVRGLKLRREMGDANRIGELEICLAGLDMPAVTTPKAAPQVKPAAKSPEAAKNEHDGSPGTVLGLAIFLALAGTVGGLVFLRKRRAGK